MSVCLLDDIAWIENASEAKRPKMIHWADQKGCRAEQCIKAKAGNDTEKHTLMPVLTL